MKPSCPSSSFSAVLLSCLLVLFLSACSPLTSEPYQSSRQKSGPDLPLLRVGVTSDAPPIIYKKNKKILGLEADLAKKFARFSGRTVKFIEVDWSDQIEALEDNKIDIIMSGMTITEPRRYRISFTNPYLRSGQILLVRLRDKGRFSTGIYSLMNSSYAIGVVKNTTGDLFITRTINGAKMKRFKSSESAVKALINKDIDAFVYDAPMVCHYAAINENAKLTPILTLATEEFLAWGIRKEDSELRSQANEFLQQLETSGQLQQIIRNWIPYM
ncbi:MAG: transporter substrate-binding domain-containing protein [Thermodesulfobacteriota bacterium]